MEPIRGIYYEEIKKPDITNKFKKTEQKQKKEETSTVGGMNFDAFKDLSIPLDVQPVDSKQSTQRSRKSNSVKSTGVIPAEKQQGGYSATEPYANQYNETNTILKTAIAQIDIGLQEMQQDISLIRSNKTLRNKYQQLSLIQKNMGDYLGNKIAAARELNNTITKCNDLELKRAKELKELDNQDDDKKIMDLYNAMISMPIGGQTGIAGGFASPFGPNTFDMTYAGNPNGPTPNIVTAMDSSDAGYQNYINNKTSAQNMMLLDANPNIQQVVVHNRATGQSYFEIMDMSTMTPVPNTDKYDSSFLEDTHMDFVNNVATNVNLGESYPIIQVGGDPILNEY